MCMDTSLSGKTILITGATGGIGQAMVKAFAAEVAQLVIHTRSQLNAAKALARELPANPSLVVSADLTREAAVKRMFQQATKRFGRIDVLVANAGAWEKRDVLLHEMSLRQWQATMDGVLTSTFLCLREFMRLVARQRRGNAVLVSSTAGIFGEAGHADYASAKAALA